VWAIEGCNGVGRHLAHRLVNDGETVVDVPAKLSAQVRVFATGNGRKTDPVDAHSVAPAALRSPNLRRVHPDPELVALGLLIDRRDELGRIRTETLNRTDRHTDTQHHHQPENAGDDQTRFALPVDGGGYGSGGRYP
jgi:hypothetical protein